MADGDGAGEKKASAIQPRAAKLASLCVAATVLVSQAVAQIVLAMNGAAVAPLQACFIALGLGGGLLLFYAGHCSMMSGGAS
jgi:hypothetical protein